LNIDGQGGSFPPSIEAANSSCAGAADAGAANIPEIKIKDSDKVINPKILVIIIFHFKLH